MNLNSILCIIAYHNDGLQILLEEKNQNYDLLNNHVDQNLINDTKKFIDEKFNLNLSTNQISLLPPLPQINNKTLSIPTIIQLTLNQAVTCEDTFKKEKTLDWHPFKTLPAKLNNREIIQQTNRYLNEQYKLHELTGIHYLLPHQFTTRSLSALLSNLTNDFIKYNNIRRKFENELVIVKKDHSKKGRPITIFEYRNTKK
jgi:hypothetical protein